MKVRVTDDAASDLEQIKAYISRDDGAAAEHVIEQILATIELLGRWPRLGHDGIVSGTYERNIARTPYVIVYRIDLGSRDELIVLTSASRSARSNAVLVIGVVDGGRGS